MHFFAVSYECIKNKSKQNLKMASAVATVCFKEDLGICRSTFYTSTIKNAFPYFNCLIVGFWSPKLFINSCTVGAIDRHKI